MKRLYTTDFRVMLYGALCGVGGFSMGKDWPVITLIVGALILAGCAFEVFFTESPRPQAAQESEGVSK